MLRHLLGTKGKYFNNNDGSCHIGTESNRYTYYCNRAAEECGVIRLLDVIGKFMNTLGVNMTWNKKVILLFLPVRTWEISRKQ